MAFVHHGDSDLQCPANLNRGHRKVTNKMDRFEEFFVL